LITDYFRDIETKLAGSEVIVERSIDYKEFSDDEGMARGKLLFINGYLLQFMEYICLGKARPKYRFHLQDKDGELIFRYDNAPHYEIRTFPHHKHTPEGVEPSREMGLIEVLGQIEGLILGEVSE